MPAPTSNSTTSTSDSRKSKTPSTEKAPIPPSIVAPGTELNPALAIEVATNTAPKVPEKLQAPRSSNGLRGLNEPITSTLPVDPNGKLNALPKEVAISCSGCGFLGTYHFGVMIAFQRNAKALLSRVTRFAGASAGSLVATLMVLAPDSLEDGLHQMYEMADELHRLPLGALSPGFYLSERLGTIVNRYLPEDVRAANNRLFISLTRQKNKTNRMVSEYANREYLARCLSASCFIPIYSSGYYAVPPVIDNEPYIDGGYSMNLPVFEDIPTITISPFSGSALIAPQDRNRFEWKMTLGSQIMKVNMQNIMRGAHSLFPPSSKVLHAYYEMGYRDGLKFLLTNGLLERGNGSEC
ncbi:Patatin-like phospholipase domain-containing protein 4 [Aphelenchoides besseyi]|nr:Patatin-like phospholipase domain-containing protein 4 [Aphelenchoides besseyi]